MATDFRVGQLSPSAEESAPLFERAFDSATGSLRLERRGRLWDAVSACHRVGARGAGRCVAVIDSGFDVSVDELRRRIHPASVVTGNTIEPTGRHGTTVALLVRAVAPDATLLLLDVGADGILLPDEVAAAIRTAGRVGASAVNLSLEFPTDARPRHREAAWANLDVLASAAPPLDEYLAEVDAWIQNTEPYIDKRCRSHCEICTALSRLPAESLVSAAAGNRFDASCPACFHRVVGVGFERSDQTVRDGVVFKISGMPETVSNVAATEFFVHEPPGFLGTSFAAPLLAGYSTLLTHGSDLTEVARLTRAFFPVTNLAFLHATTPPSQLPDSAPDVLHQGLLRLAEAMPEAHRHFDHPLTTAPCGVCALVMVDWYNTFVSMLIAINDTDRAVGLARIAAVLAPNSASVFGNLGLALGRIAKAESDLERKRALLEDSAQAYDRAAMLSPNVSLYADSLREVQEALAALRTQ